MSYTIFTPPIFDQYLADIYGFFELPIWNFHQVLSNCHPTISGQKISSQGHLRSFNTFWIDHQKMANVCLPWRVEKISKLRISSRILKFFKLLVVQMIQIQI